MATKTECEGLLLARHVSNSVVCYSITYATFLLGNKRACLQCHVNMIGFGGCLAFRLRLSRAASLLDKSGECLALADDNRTDVDARACEGGGCLGCFVPCAGAALMMTYTGRRVTCASLTLG